MSRDGYCPRIAGPRRPRLVIVGESPSAVCEDWSLAQCRRLALTGRVGKRLSSIIWPELEAAEGWHRYLKLVGRANVLERWPGKRWPIDEAKKQADELLMRLPKGARLVLCGRVTSDSFGLTRDTQWMSLHDRFLGNKIRFLARCAAIPHPSGRNRWYNDPENVQALRLFFQDLKMEVEL